MSHGPSPRPNAFFLWTDGSPSAAENPPHDRRWRALVRDTTERSEPFAPDEIGLDFFLEPKRRLIDLDNLVRLAVDGLRDAGAVAQGGIGLDTIVASKRVAPPLGLAITVAMGAGGASQAPLFGAADLEVESAVIPRDGSRDDKVAWREAVRAAYGAAPASGPVALDIEARTQLGLTGILKPVIDGLGAYLGNGTAGGREFTPLDDRVVLLRVRRVAELDVVLRVRAGTPAPLPGHRVVPRQPGAVVMDPDYSFSTSDLEDLARGSAWRRIFALPEEWSAG